MVDLLNQRSGCLIQVSVEKPLAFLVHAALIDLDRVYQPYYPREDVAVARDHKYYDYLACADDEAVAIALSETGMHESPNEGSEDVE